MAISKILARTVHSTTTDGPYQSTTADGPSHSTNADALSHSITAYGPSHSTTAYGPYHPVTTDGPSHSTTAYGPYHPDGPSHSTTTDGHLPMQEPLLNDFTSDELDNSLSDDSYLINNQPVQLLMASPPLPPLPPPDAHGQAGSSSVLLRLVSPEKVMLRFPGKTIGSFRKQTAEFAKQCVFGGQLLTQSSLSGRNNTHQIDPDKLRYIKTLVQGRSNMNDMEFEAAWIKCLELLKKCCQKWKKKYQQLAPSKSEVSCGPCELFFFFFFV